MLSFIIRRILLMILTMIVISLVAFIVIQLPPGDFLTALTAERAAQNEVLDTSLVMALRAQYGARSASGTCNIGTGSAASYSVAISASPSSGTCRSRASSWDRLGLTLVVSMTTLVFVWLISFPIGVYSAVRQHSAGDLVATFFGFLGLAIPNFLLALVLMYVASRYFGAGVGGLFSPPYSNARMELGSRSGPQQHLWLPVIVLGASGMAALIRIMRANLLDELNKPYVEMVRSPRRARNETSAQIPRPCRAQPLRLDDRLGVAGADLRRDDNIHRSQPADRRAVAAQSALLPRTCTWQAVLSCCCRGSPSSARFCPTSFSPSSIRAFDTAREKPSGRNHFRILSSRPLLTKGPGSAGPRC